MTFCLVTHLECCNQKTKAPSTGQSARAESRGKIPDAESFFPPKTARQALSFLPSLARSSLPLVSGHTCESTKLQKIKWPLAELSRAQHRSPKGGARERRSQMKLQIQTDHFRNRQQAGRLLAERLGRLGPLPPERTVLLAVPRGGVPIAFEVSQMLGLPLSVLILRKIGAPKQANYGIGAVTEEGFVWVDPDAARLVGASDEYLQNTIHQHRAEIDRRTSIFRGGAPLPDLKDRTVILIDDGLATGITARAAACFVRTKQPEKIVLAVPVCASDVIWDLKSDVDHIVCLRTPRPFYAAGSYFKDFHRVSNHEVLQLLSRSKGLV